MIVPSWKAEIPLRFVTFFLITQLSLYPLTQWFHQAAVQTNFSPHHPSLTMLTVSPVALQMEPVASPTKCNLLPCSHDQVTLQHTPLCSQVPPSLKRSIQR